MAVETLIVDRAPCTLSLLLFRRLKRLVPGLVEATFDQNPGLAGLGLFLPHGTRVEVEMPEPVARGQVAPQQLIRLTD